MDMRFEHTTIQAETPCGTCRTSFTAEGEVAIPGSLREATHVLHTSATAVVESADALQGRISVRGRVIFCVIYTQGAQTKAESIEATADFTHLCDAPGTVERAEAEARAWVEHAEARVQNGRMMMRANVRMYARADAVQSIEVLTTVDSPHAQTQQERISMLQTTARGSGEALVREEFTLPPELAITDTLAAWGSIRTDDVAGGQGRVSLSGEMTLEALHTSSLPGRPLVMTRHTLPVSEAVKITGNAGEELHGRMQVKDVAAASLDMGEGERTLRVEALLGLKAWSTRLESLEALSDAYTVSGEDVRLGRQELLLQTGTHCMHAAESGRAPLLLPAGEKPLRTVLAAFAAPVLTGFAQQGSRLVTEGMLETELVYMSDDSMPLSIRMEAPFRTAFAATADEDDLLTLTVENVEAVPVTSDRAELRYVLHADIEGRDAAHVSLVTEAETIPSAEVTKDVVLYFVQPGEDAWEVAKRYRITAEQLHALNPGMGETLQPGQGVVVWHRNA